MSHFQNRRRRRKAAGVCLSTALRNTVKTVAADWPGEAKAAINRAHSKRWRDRRGCCSKSKASRHPEISP